MMGLFAMQAVDIAHSRSGMTAAIEARIGKFVTRVTWPERGRTCGMVLKRSKNENAIRGRSCRTKCMPERSFYCTNYSRNKTGQRWTFSTIANTKKRKSTDLNIRPNTHTKVTRVVQLLCSLLDPIDLQSTSLYFLRRSRSSNSSETAASSLSAILAARALPRRLISFLSAAARWRGGLRGPAGKRKSQKER